MSQISEFPHLKDFGIESSVFIRKLDNRNHWNSQEVTDLGEHSILVAETIFKNQGKYSFWYVNKEQDFYGMVASLTARSEIIKKNIDFIWITRSELYEAGIVPEPISEGDCLYVKPLHFNAEINKDIAQKLCYSLTKKERKAHRCKKAEVIAILKHQQNLGCKATNTDFQSCQCETWG